MTWLLFAVSSSLNNKLWFLVAQYSEIIYIIKHLFKLLFIVVTVGIEGYLLYWAHSDYYLMASSFRHAMPKHLILLIDDSILLCSIITVALYGWYWHDGCAADAFFMPSLNCQIWWFIIMNAAWHSLSISALESSMNITWFSAIINIALTASITLLFWFHAWKHNASSRMAQPFSTYTNIEMRFTCHAFHYQCTSPSA